MLRDSLVCAFAVFLAGCTTTSVVPGGALDALHAGGNDGDLVVHEATGGAVRIDPNTSLAFHLVGGHVTDWAVARELSVDSEGITVPSGTSSESFRWSDIETAEVSNVDGGKTFVGVLITCAIAVALLPLALAGNAGTPGAHLHDASAVPSAVVQIALASGANGGKATGSDDDGGGSRALLPGAVLNHSASKGEQLFSGNTRRAGIVRLVGTLDAAGDIVGTTELSNSAAVSLRLLDIVDLGGGARLTQVLPSGSGVDYEPVGFFRGGFHFELGARRRFAIPFGVDAGAGQEVPIQVKLNIGLAVRATDHVWFGLSPFNPMYTSHRDPRLAAVAQWSFPTTVDASFVF